MLLRPSGTEPVVRVMVEAASQDIAQRWLDFFEKKGHTVVPSSSLVSPDPSLLFTVAGMVALVASLLITLHSIEQTFNSIWRVAAARPKVTRFLIYWTVLTLGALMAAASLALSARFLAVERAYSSFESDLRAFFGR